MFPFSVAELSFDRIYYMGCSNAVPTPSIPDNTIMEFQAVKNYTLRDFWLISSLHFRLQNDDGNTALFLSMVGF